MKRLGEVVLRVKLPVEQFRKWDSIIVDPRVQFSVNKVRGRTWLSVSVDLPVCAMFRELISHSSDLQERLQIICGVKKYGIKIKQQKYNWQVGRRASLRSRKVKQTRFVSHSSLYFMRVPAVFILLSFIMPQLKEITYSLRSLLERSNSLLK